MTTDPLWRSVVYFLSVFRYSKHNIYTRGAYQVDQFDRENTSRTIEPEQTRSFEPPRDEQPVQPPVQELPKQKKSKTPLVLTLLLLLALAAAGMFGWMWYQQNGRVGDLEADLASSKNKVAQLESSANAESKLTDDMSQESDDADDPVDVVLRYQSAMVAFESAKLEGKLGKQSGDFALVSVSSSLGSGALGYYLKKVDGAWVIIGNGSVNEDLTRDFGLPEDFLSDSKQ